MDKKCLAVLLACLFILQDPYVLRTYRLRYGQNLFLEENGIVRDYGGTEVCYYLNGGVFPEETRIKGRYGVSSGFQIPVKEGYNFAGWYTDSGFLNKADGENTEGKLYAKWTKCIDGDYNVQMYPYRNTSVFQRGQRKLKDCSYRFLSEVKIPGMPSTRETDAKEQRITETSQYPQGLCITDEYLLISAYSGIWGGGLGCIHIFDRATGEYCATIGAKKNSHMGGLAFDGESVWVCHSGSRTLGRISYSDIRRTAQDKPCSVVDGSALFEEFTVSNTPSCIAYYDGKLWVATHTKLFDSKMTAYQVTAEGLKQAGSYRIPKKVQGIAFDEDGKVYISASFGRRRSSYLKVYRSLEKMDQKPESPAVKIEMPPCSEEIALTDEEIYVLFESAGEKYLEGTDGKGTSIAPVDEILALSRSSIR